jgi:ABC-type nitrate/sulfonate/bicarbonate transport system ATPase subunit
MTPPIEIRIENVWKSFDRGRIEVLKGVSLNVEKGAVVALCGTSGCGKSTLLNVISGLEPADRGSVHISGAWWKERKPDWTFCATASVMFSNSTT